MRTTGFSLTQIIIRIRVKIEFFFIQRDIKKGFLLAVEHRIQIDYQQTLRKTENGNRIPLITIPIDKGENAFTMLSLSL